MTKLREFLRISDAAEYLGVSPNTLLNQQLAGKVVAHRHPVNHYRLFKRADLDAMLSRAGRPSRRQARLRWGTGRTQANEGRKAADRVFAIVRLVEQPQRK